MLQPSAATRYALFALLLSTASGTALAAADGGLPHVPAPQLRLEREVGGEDALRTLGTRIKDVAAWHRMSTERLQKILREDPRARLDRGGRLFYIEQTVVAQAEPTTAAVAAYPLDQTFRLHSRPGAARVIYLDFNGEVVSGTAWANGATINAPAYDLDGNAASFSNTELERIQGIWQRVAEDYAPFDVDVTTEEPAAADLARNGSGDTRFGTRALITRSNALICSGCGGVAYVGVFDEPNQWSRYQPAWVFYNSLAGGAEKAVAEATSHEVGHNLGLSHDGTAALLSSQDYYEGHGSGATGWAPIMGVGYSRELTQWSQGEYPDASNDEDDLALIPSHGAPLRSDDHGSSRASASTLAMQANGGTMTVLQSGVIERRTDLDVFAFETAGGTVQLQVTPSPLARSSNLDVSASLLDAAGNVVASSNEASGLGATLSAEIAAGTYYVQVDGVGDNSPAPGYPDYGSLGQYQISGSVPAAAAALPQVSLDLETLVVRENGSVQVGLNLSAPSSQTVSVAISFSGSATPGVDYEPPASSTVSFAPGTTSASFTLRSLDDALNEVHETIVYTLGTPSGALPGAITTGTTRIRDDDAAPEVRLSRSAQTFSEAGGVGFVDVQLSAAAGRTLSVELSIGGSAVNGEDYVRVPTRVNFAEGVTSRRIRIVPVDDTTSEAGETVIIGIASSRIATIGSPSQYTGTITDND